MFDQSGKVLDKRRSAAGAETKTGDQEARTLDDLERQVEVLRKYIVDGARLEVADRELVEAFDAVCRHVESLTGQPLDLAAGLKQSGVEVEMERADIDGSATAVKATSIASTARVAVKFNDGVVRETGEFTAVEINGPIG
ncbi:hypothetical protein D5S19_16305 [Amycolatopsis panacis]|uniref:Uncharacterized protein n=1 Tax=Amycolatopsis panacis TaxID=2340917 RepID=A0A419I3F5_9PSEU|nr:hypothetical protein D5S19_16305 [Amycolatopsis panacis]